MIKVAGIRVGLMALVAATLAQAQGVDALIEVPSGQPITLHDTIIGEPGPGGLTARFRFVAPNIARDLGIMTFIEAEADMHHLCETYALPRIASPGPKVAQIVISLSDRPLAFGEVAPDVTQFFEAYRPDGTQCIWEGY